MVFQDTVDLEGVSIDEAFDRTLSWIEKEKAKVIEQQRPTFIKVEHGRKNWKIAQNMFKIITFTFSPDTRKLKVELINTYWPRWFGREDKSIILWSKAVEDYYRYISVPLDVNTLRRIYPEKNINLMTMGTMFYLILFIIFNGFFLYILLDMMIRCWDGSIPAIIVVGGMSGGNIYLMSWTYRLIRDLKFYLKRKQLLYPK